MAKKQGKFLKELKTAKQTLQAANTFSYSKAIVAPAKPVSHSMNSKAKEPKTKSTIQQEFVEVKKARQ